MNLRAVIWMLGVGCWMFARHLVGRIFTPATTNPTASNRRSVLGARRRLLFQR